MRWLLPLPLALATFACAGPVRPAVTPTLSSMPSNAHDRSEHLESAGRTPTAESRASLSENERKVETAAATAAAWLGIFFSTSANATLGAAAPIDENELVAPTPEPRKEEAEAEEPESVFGPTLEE